MSKKKNRKRNAKRPQSATVSRAAEAGAVIPQDHAAKDEATGQLREVTYKGVTWTMEPADLNDYLIVEAANGGNYTPMMQALIPDETARAAVLDKLTDEKGRVPMERVIKAVEEIGAFLKVGN